MHRVTTSLFYITKLEKKKRRRPIPPPRKNYKNKPEYKDLKSGKNTGIVRPVKGNWSGQFRHIFWPFSGGGTASHVLIPQFVLSVGFCFWFHNRNGTKIGTGSTSSSSK
jgi:hypothetical protein